MSSASRKVLEPGARVDHFRVVRLLAEGGFGEVYLARDVKLGRRVALKVIHPRHVGSGEAVERFLFEVRATARFNHPNIVTVYAVGEHEGMPYVALEYLEGQTLRQRMKERRLTTREVLRVGSVIARALEEAHQRSILHRDLKPENVLIPRDGRVRVLDFGLAKKISGRDETTGTEASQPAIKPIRVDGSLGAAGAMANTIATPSQRAGADNVDASTPTMLDASTGAGVGDAVPDRMTAPGNVGARARQRQREAARLSDGILSLPPAPRIARSAATGDAALPALPEHFAPPRSLSAPEAVEAVEAAGPAGTVTPTLTPAPAAAVEPARDLASEPLRDLAPEPALDGADEARDTVEHLTLATYTSLDDDMVRGTPPYMAPEQWRGETLRSPTDIWALGVMLYELLAAKLPYAVRGRAAATELPVLVCSEDPAPSLPTDANVSAELAELVARCMNKEAADRPSAGDVADALEAMLAGGVELAEEQGPFRGLLSFSERHAGVYFGREPEVAAFLERLRDEPTLAIVGPSGAGKSSFVQAGVVPRLREQGRWLVLTLRPGNTPFEALASRLRHGERSRSMQASFGAGSIGAVPDAESGSEDTSQPDAAASPSQQLISGLAKDDEALARELYETPERLALLLQRLAEASSTRVLLVVDQLEELVALTPDAETRARFMRALASAADDAEEPVRLVFTLRDDFLGKLVESSAARQVLSSIVVLRSPDASALETIVTRPLDVFNYRYDDAKLPAEMVAEVADSSACLPLLSFTARALWERRDRQHRALRRADYDAIGGVAGALASHADSVLAGMPPAELEIARQQLLRLVSAEGTRRSASRESLVEGLDEHEAERVLSRLTTSRLLSVRKLDSGGAAHYELAHESLISSWRRLRHWLDESAEERAFLAEIEQAATLWEKRGERPDEVWRDEALDDAIKTLDRMQDAPPSIVQRFVEAAIREREAQRLADERRRKRRRRSIALLVGALSVVSVAVATAWIVSLSRKEARARDMLARALAEAGNGALLGGDAGNARAMARAALEIQDSGRARIVWWRAAAKGALWTAEVGTTIRTLDVDRAGHTAAVVDQRGFVHVVDFPNRSMRQVKTTPAFVSALRVAADGRSIIVAVYDRERRGKQSSRKIPSQLQVIDLDSGRVKRTVNLVGEVAQIVATRDGRICALRYSDVVCFDTSGKQIFRSVVQQAVAMRAIDKRVRLVRQSHLPKRGQQMRYMLEAFDLGVPQAIWRHELTRWGYPGKISANGSLTAIAGMQQQVRIVGIDGRNELLHVRTNAAALDFDPSGHRLALGNKLGDVDIWDVQQRRMLRRLSGHSELITAVAFAAGGKRLVSTDRGGRLVLWDAAAEPPRLDSGHTGLITALAVRPDKKLVASAGRDATLRLWDARTGAEVQRLTYKHAYPTALAFNPQGDQLAEGRSDGSVVVDNADSGHERKFLGTGHARSVYALAYSHDGRTLASASQDGLVALWRARGPGKSKQLRTMRLATRITSLDFSADDKRLLVAGFGLRQMDGRAAVFEVESGKKLVDITPEDGTASARWLGDGDELIVFNRMGQFARVDLQGKRKAWLFSMPSFGLPPVSELIAAGGRRFLRSMTAASGFGATIEVFDIERRSRRPLRGHRFGLYNGSFALDGSVIATAGRDYSIRYWDVDSGRSPWHVLLVSRRSARFYTLDSEVNALDGTRRPIAAGKKRWLDRVAKAAFLADERDERVCLLTRARWLELWDTRADKLLGRVRLPGEKSGGSTTIRDMRTGKTRTHELINPLPYHRVFVRGTAHCGAVSRRGVRYWRVGAKEAIDLGRGLDGGALGSERIWRRQINRLFIHDQAGSQLLSLDTRADVTAMAVDGERMLAVLSRTRSASMQWLAEIQRDGTLKRLVTFSARLPVTELLALRGLAGSVPAMVAAGTANGEVLIFDLQRRRVVSRYHLHGAIVALWQHQRRLIAVSELGGQRSIDLAPLMRPHCELLRRVWRHSKHVWIGTQSLVRGPPLGHRCSELSAP
ncbi:MAG: protein kinase [Myxococcales bacterium]|nr:protein kinase [Myxococcales bacterium]